MENNKVLIEIAAQHPLIDGKPGLEFEKRLVKGIQIFNVEKEKGNTPIIYIPGSIHSIKKDNEWRTDDKSLSEAGKMFLIEHSIAPTYIKGEEDNKRIKKNGVYNSGDECYVASQIAKENDINRIISVVSPVQVYRKALFYILNGFSPEMYGIGVKDTFHNYIGEAFWSLYITYFIDHTWQNSFMAYKTREERDKYFKMTDEIKKIIENGIVMPPEIVERKTHMLELYNAAKESMEDKRITGKGTLISIDSLNEKSINELLELINETKENEDIRIIFINSENNDTIDLPTELIQTLDKLNLKIDISRTDSVNTTMKWFNKNSIANWHHITESQNTMIEAILCIQNGCIPILHTVPSKSNNPSEYIENIDYLYGNLLRIKSLAREQLINDDYAIVPSEK